MYTDKYHHAIILTLIFYSIATSSTYLQAAVITFITAVYKEVLDYMSRMKSWPVTWYKGTADILDFAMYVPGLMIGAFFTWILQTLLGYGHAQAIGIFAGIATLWAIWYYFNRMRTVYLNAHPFGKYSPAGSHWWYLIGATSVAAVLIVMTLIFL